MDRQSDFGFGFAMGCVAGASTVFLVGFAFVVATHLDWLDRWQTLVAGAMALSAAAPTVYFLHRQIDQQRELANEAKRRELLAARAMLPASLAKLATYAKDCGDQLRAYCKSAGDASPGISMIVPLVPVDELPVLRDCVKYGDEDLRGAVEQLLSHLQIQSSRLVGFASMNVAPEWWQFSAGVAPEFLLDALELHARTSALFDYARGRVDQLGERLSSVDMHNAARVMGLNDGDFSYIYEAIERRYQ